MILRGDATRNGAQTAENRMKDRGAHDGETAQMKRYHEADEAAAAQTADEENREEDGENLPGGIV